MSSDIRVYWIGHWPGKPQSAVYCIIESSQVPSGVERGAGYDMDSVVDRDEKLTTEGIRLVFNESSWPFSAGPGYAGDLVIVLYGDISDKVEPPQVWNGEPGVIIVSSKKVIDDFPGTCLDCGGKVYVGLNEIEHKVVGASCKGRVNS